MVKNYQSKQKLRMAIACDIHLDGKDTRANHMLELFNNLSELCETYLLVPKPKQIKVTSPNIIYVLWFDIPLLRLILYQITLFYNLFVLCRKVKIDIIYARQETFNFSPLIISKLLNIPYVIEINGLLIEEKRVLGINRRLIALTRLSEKINYKHAVQIISVTQGIKNGIMQRYNIPDEKIVVIENGANTDLFKPMEQNKLNLNLDENYNYVGYVGSFARWHGLENLIKSAPLVLKVCKNTKFIFIGDGPLKEELFNMVDNFNLRDDFVFIGRTPHDEMPQYINIFDVCMILKDKDISGSPLKLWEYMACGKPVVATNTKDFKALEKCGAGILVDSGKHEEVANAIQTLLNDRELSKQMGTKARKCVVENHSWERVAMKVIQVCRESIKLRS